MFSCGRKTYWKQNYFKWITLRTIIMQFPSLTYFFKHKTKMVGDCCRIKFLWCSVGRNKLMHFQSKISIFKFLWRTCNRVDGKASFESCLSKGQAKIQVFFKFCNIKNVSTAGLGTTCIWTQRHGEVNSRIAEHRQLTNHTIDWNQC